MAYEGTNQGQQGAGVDLLADTLGQGDKPGRIVLGSQAGLTLLDRTLEMHGVIVDGCRLD